MYLITADLLRRPVIKAKIKIEISPNDPDLMICTDSLVIESNWNMSGLLMVQAETEELYFLNVHSPKKPNKGVKIWQVVLASKSSPLDGCHDFVENEALISNFHLNEM